MARWRRWPAARSSSRCVPFDVLHQQVLLNAQNATSNYDIIAIDLPQFGEYKPFPHRSQSADPGKRLRWLRLSRGGLDGAQFGGQQLGIPIQPHPEIFAYRKDLFEEAGLEAPETMDDVLAAAKKLHGSKEGLSGICWNAARGTPLGQTFIQVEGSFGQAPIDLAKEGDDFKFDDIQPANMQPMIDTPAGHAIANYLKALMDVSPPGILNMAWDERVRVFAQGGCAMTYVWSGRSAIYELDENAPAHGKVGYVPHPHGPDAATKSTLGGWYLGIPTNLEAGPGAARLEGDRVADQPGDDDRVHQARRLRQPAPQRQPGRGGDRALPGHHPRRRHGDARARSRAGSARRCPSCSRSWTSSAPRCTRCCPARSRRRRRSRSLRSRSTGSWSRPATIELEPQARAPPRRIRGERHRRPLGHCTWRPIMKLSGEAAANGAPADLAGGHRAAGDQSLSDRLCPLHQLPPLDARPAAAAPLRRAGSTIRKRSSTIASSMRSGCRYLS